MTGPLERIFHGCTEHLIVFCQKNAQSPLPRNPKQFATQDRQEVCSQFVANLSGSLILRNEFFLPFRPSRRRRKSAGLRAYKQELASVAPQENSNFRSNRKDLARRALRGLHAETLSN